jgi:tRNA nucleotidyltransferase (CCA-adding enzyme)
MGRHLIERGLTPSPDFSHILEKCFEAQLDGEFTSEAGGLDFLDTMVNGAI